MRLDRLDLTRYGKFTDVTLDFGRPKAGSPDLTLVYGLNEAGKSTAFSGFLDLLFGIPERSDYGFLHALNALQIGGLLTFDGQTHHLVRLKKRGASLVDGDGQPVNEALLSAALGGISQKAYRTMFSLDDQSLREGGKSILQSEGDLGELLFSASSGLADLSRALAAIQEEAEAIHKRRGQKTELAALKRELDQLKEKRAEIDTQALAFSRLVEAARQAEAAFRTAEDALGAARSEEVRLSNLVTALPLARERARLLEALQPLSDLPRPPRTHLESLPTLIRDETRLETALSTLRARLRALDEEAEAGMPEALPPGMEARLQALEDARARHRTALSDLPRRRQSLLVEEAALGLLLRTLGKQDHDKPESLVMEASLTARFRDLIAEKSGIETALARSLRERERAEENLARLKAEREALGDPVSPARMLRLAAALEGLANRGEPARLDAEERQAERFARELEDALQPLRRLIGSADALPALVLPDRRQMESWRDSAARLQTRRLRHQDAIEALEERIVASGERLRAARAADVPDDESAARARAERDRLWENHRNSLTAETADAFESALRRDDGVTAARLARAADLAELGEMKRLVAADRDALAREGELLASLEAEESALRQAIAALMPEGLLRADLPLAEALTGAAALIERLAEARMTREALLESRERIAALTREATAGTESLAEALSEAGETVDPDAGPSLLRLRAEALLDGWRRQAAEIDRLARREAELEAESAERRRDHAEAEAAAERFSRNWQEAIARSWFLPDATLAEVRALIDALADLPGRIEKCEQLRQRIRTMEEDQQHYATEVDALLRLCGLDPKGEIEERDRSLTAHHSDLRRRSETAARLARERATLEEERQRLEAEWTAHGHRRAQLLDAFGAEDLEEAIRLLDRLAERDRLEERQRSIDHQLLDISGAEDLVAALARLDGLDREETERQRAKAADLVALLSEESRERYGEWTLARNRLDAVGGDGAVAALEANRATLLLTIEDLGYRYLKLRTGALAAGSALELYREKHRSAMMRRASDAFRQITRGDYSGLTARADRDRETLIGLTRDGGSRLTDAMSTGTRYQLYLALRLAGYEELAALRPPVPFIADDIMETFDEPRSEEVFRLFGDMARIGQVIYFTHHRHLCDIARTVVPDVRIIVL